MTKSNFQIGLRIIKFNMKLSDLDTIREDYKKGMLSDLELSEKVISLGMAMKSYALIDNEETQKSICCDARLIDGQCEKCGAAGMAEREKQELLDEKIRTEVADIR